MNYFKHIITLTACVALTSLTAPAQPKAQAVRPRVFINPGHGGHNSDDRYEPFFNEATQKKEPYYESDSNLNEGMALRDILRSKGYQVFISRVENDTEDDLNLFEISQMALNCGADVFFAIHSNDTGTSRRTNFPMALYKGFNGKPANEGSEKLADLVVSYLYQNEATTFDHSPLSRGDWSFYNWGYKVGLGVMRWNKVPGILSEDCFHDYLPERERLLNKDYSWNQAWLNSCALDEFFTMPGSKTGVVSGIARYDYGRKGKTWKTMGKDSRQAVNGIPVLLIDMQGNEVASYNLDTFNNGFYCFTNVKPGRYTVEMDGADPQEVEVKANKSTYCNINIVTQQAEPVEDAPTETTNESSVEDDIKVVHSAENKDGEGQQ